MKFTRLSIYLLTCCFMLSALSVHAGEVFGNLKKWDHITVEFTGPMTGETATPNPFRDYRLNVTFTGPSGQIYLVPGFYAADGDAANTSATSGNKWHVIFTPDEAGSWTYSASFREGNWVAISLDPNAGTPTSFDGDNGSFTVAPLDGSEQGFYAKGKLRYVGKHHLQFAESGEYYLKSGTDGPENFWGYPGFDNTDNPASNFATFAGHADEWNEGDPTWGAGRGKEIIGAINYLESVKVNGIYTMIFNAALNNGIGDHGAAFPWLEPASETNDITRYDVSKLAQWNIVLDHCDLKGIQWQCMFAEHENQSFFEWRDNPSHTSNDYGFSDTRKLYFREIIARFGSHHAIVYNLAEETQWPGTGHEAVMTDQAIRDYWQYLRDLDPYNHPRTTHCTSGTATNFYPTFYGDPNMECTSIQGDNNFYDGTVALREGSSAAGRPIAIYWDEQSPGAIDDVNDVRKNIYWPQIMAGGAGAQWYLAGHDASLTNYETDLGGYFDRLFRMTGMTRVFVQQNMPFYDASPRQDLIDTGYCLAVEEEAYLIYLPNGGTAALDLSGNTKGYTLQWFDPRNGGELQNGSVTSMTGGAIRNIGTPPNSPTEDWACLIKVASVTAGLSASATKICDSETVTFSSNSVGTIDSYSWNFGDGASPATATTEGPHTVSYATPGSKTISLTVSGPDGSDTREISDYVTVYDNCGELTKIEITPATKNVVIGSSLEFVASGTDPVGSTVAIFPTWAVDGGGSIDQSGEFSATTLGGPFTVSATSGGVTGTAIVNVVEPIDVVLNDSFTRDNAAALGDPETGNTWREVEGGSEAVEIVGNQAYFTSSDAANSPLMKALFAEQNTGVVHWSFDMDWSRTGGEGTYEVFMQLGHGLIDTDPETGVAVDLKWGGPNNGMTDHEGFGYVGRDGTVEQLQIISSKTRIDVYADMISRTYDIFISDSEVVSDIPFRKGDAVIKEVRFFTNSVNTANFGGRGFDNVYVANRVDFTSGVNSSFNQYIANYPSLTGEDARPGADPDGDGIANLLEQWFASDPTVSDLGNAQIRSSSNGSDFHFEFSFDASVTGSSLIYETSPDLGIWTSHELDPSWITEDGNLRHVKTIFEMNQGSQFHRLRVE